jgi:hypothetical protein
MGALLVVAFDERIKTSLLWQRIRRRRLRRFGLQRPMHPLVASVLFGMSWLDAFDLGGATRRRVC